MGAGNAGSTGGGGGGVGPAGVTYKTVGTNRKTVKQYGTVADAKQTSKRYEFRESGARKIDKQKIGSFSILKPAFKAGSRKTRDYFKNTVLTSTDGKKKFGYNKQQFEALSVAEQNKIYDGYIGDRQSGKTDAIGRDTPKTMAGIDAKSASAEKVTTIPKVNTAPTEAEVSQSAATDTTAVAETKKEDDIYTRKRKTKARGRSMMTLTGPRGLKKDEKLTLGRPSLLGS